MPATATPPLPSAPAWQEFARPSSGEAQDWAAWVSPLGDGGDALYRSLVFADGVIAVTVELHPGGVSGTRTLHRGRCGVPRDPERPPERILLLLRAADRAAARAMEADRGGEGAAAVHGPPSSRRVPQDDPRGGRRDGGASAAPRGREDRIPEHASREEATAAWGRRAPPGRAHRASRV